jgi:hypothetical protein
MIGEAFGQFRTYWRDLLGITLIAALGLILVGGVLVFLVGAIFRASETIAWITILLGLFVFWVFTLLFTGAITRLIATELAGQPSKVGDSLSWGVSHLGPILVVSLITAGINIVLSVIGELIDGVFETDLFTSLVSIVTLVVFVFLSVAIPAFVVEGVRGTAALQRSVDLVRPYFWHSLGTIVLAYLVGVGALIVASVFMLGGPLLAVLAFFALFLFFMPFFSLVLVSLYLNLRVKAGGLTQEVLRTELARSA